jgi:hypothetical protein
MWSYEGQYGERPERTFGRIDIHQISIFWDTFMTRARSHRTKQPGVDKRSRQTDARAPPVQPPRATQ